MADNEQDSRSIQAKRNPAILIAILIFVEFRQRFRIKKDRRGALKRYPMLIQIVPGFSWIPLELIREALGHFRMIPRKKASAKN